MIVQIGAAIGGGLLFLVRLGVFLSQAFEDEEIIRTRTRQVEP